MSYDAENRQTAAGTNSYSYDGAGQRVSETTGAGQTTFVYDAFGQLAAEYAGGPVWTKDYVRAGGQIAAIENASGAPCTTCYLSYDFLGSVRMVTDQSANVIARHDYAPFGQEIQAGVGPRTSLWGASDNVNQKFTGQERDGETNLDFFQARYLSSGLGRFMSPDPHNAGAAMKNPQSWNAYAYVMGNPLNSVDPTGTDTITTPPPLPPPCQDGDPNCSVTVYGGSPDPISTDPGGVCSVLDCGIFTFSVTGYGVAPRPVQTESSQSGGTILQNPPRTPNYCASQGGALSPAQYAAEGKRMAAGLAIISQGSGYDVAMSFGAGILAAQFSRGSELDAQTKASGTEYQKVAYGNYAFGAFFAGTGASLNEALSAANAYGNIQQTFKGAYEGRYMDTTYPHLPVLNVQDITNGYNAALQGTLCHH